MSHIVLVKYDCIMSHMIHVTYYCVMSQRSHVIHQWVLSHVIVFSKVSSPFDLPYQILFILTFENFCPGKIHLTDKDGHCLRKNHVTYVKQSCHTCERIKLHIWKSRIAHMKTWYRTCERLMSRTRKCHVTHMKESCHTTHICARAKFTSPTRTAKECLPCALFIFAFSKTRQWGISYVCIHEYINMYTYIYTDVNICL